MEFTHNLKSPVEFTQRTAFQCRVEALANINITSITFFGVYSTYTKTENGEIKVQDVNLTCSNSLDTNTVNKDAVSVVFNVNYPLSMGSSVIFNVNVSGTGNFGIIEGADQSNNINIDMAAGIRAVQGTQSSVYIPSFMITYEILDEPYLHNININDGYFYFEGLATKYSDYNGYTDWLIDERKNINDGYPYIDGLATKYSDYKKATKGLQIYRNGVKLKAYRNGKLLTAHNYLSEQ